MDVVTLGEILIDMFPAEVGRKLVTVTAFHPKPGGAPANVAVAVSRLGASSAFIGKVGDDLFGHFLVDVLKRERVETRGIRIDPEARTTMAIIAMPDVNSAEFVFYRNPGADILLRAEELDRDLLRSARAFHCGSLSLVSEPAYGATLEAIRLARASDALVSFDVNYRPSLWRDATQTVEKIRAVIAQVDLLKVNEAELKLLTGNTDLETAAQVLLNLGPNLVVVTCGAKGSYFQIAEGGAHTPAFSVQTVDAIGCGDAFMAGMLTRLVSANNWRTELTVPRLRAHLRYANAVGALTALGQGVIPALPTAEQVDDFLREHSG